MNKIAVDLELSLEDSIQILHGNPHRTYIVTERVILI